MYKEKIKQWFVGAVRASTVPYELKDKVLSNKHTTPLFIKNLEKEVMLAVQHAARKLKKEPSLHNVKQLTQDLVETWLQTIENANQEMIQSDLAKRAKEQAKQNEIDLEKTSNGVISGEFKEYEKDGLILDENIIGQRQ